MTRFLASVRDAAETDTALTAGADIIDLKDPAKGALGALSAAAIASCLARIAGAAEVSATVGDLPMCPETVRNAVRETAALGVDHVKLGLFPEGDAERSLSLLAAETRNVSLILVVFADALPRFEAISAAARIGAFGVMLDTAGKDGSSLLDHLPLAALSRFVTAARAEGLLVGLAGSLKALHVPKLLALQPDLLGFRGALCEGQTRASGLDAGACAAIRALIPRAAREADKAALADLLPAPC